MRKILITTMLLLALVAGYNHPAAAIYLPSLPGGYVDGIQTAIQYDDFYSYSNQILRTIQDKNPSMLPVATYGNFGFATGTGGLDVILYTGAGTKNRNQGVGPDGPDAGNKGDYNFEDPVAAPTGGGTSLSGWWGQNDQNNDGTLESVNGPVTVGQVLTYLHTLNPLNNIPVFYMDMNQTGTEASLTISAEVYLIDANGNVQHAWSLDTNPQTGDGTYDPNSPATAAGEIGPLVGTSGTNYGTVNHNLGSGKADFIAYAPTMDLSLFDPTWKFITHFELGGLNDGYEEIFLTGTITPGPPPVVPEPGTMLLLGTGLLGLGIYRWRQFKG